MKRWWLRRTLRFRLAVWYALGGALLLAAFSATIYFYVAMRMGQPIGLELRGDFTEVLARLRVGPDGRIFWDNREVPPDVQWAWDDPWIELWDGNHRLIRRLWPLKDPQTEQLQFAPAGRRETISVYNVIPDIRVRTLAAPYAVDGRDTGWMLRVMRIHQPAANALGALLLIIAITLPIMVALLALGGYILTRRWLKPLDDLAAEANRITAVDLGRRLPIANPDDELGRLATIFNATLARLQNSFATLDQFVANASHELRTPLTTLRSVGEVGLARGRTTQEYRDIIGSMLEEAQRLEALVDRLLQLARAEGGRQTVQQSVVRLDEVITDMVSELGILAEDKDQQIAVKAAAVSLTTDPVLFRQALKNLLDNAIKHSPAGTLIRVSLKESEDGFRVEVTDNGPGIAPEHRNHVTDRFYRAAGAQRSNESGFGLGLAITKAYMRVLKGRLEYEPVHPHGSTFRLVLPRG